eukprot:TRINITY_DN2887_c0_g1_i1.p1 TRINITY_DN2887_c0_g1~~TRINITY_DN2887_c0_g1_i1.p1  ORF type:complete len:141 (-),score=49.06 TRINITY_DN2887_c0_g1_i1:89-511(-)
MTKLGGEFCIMMLTTVPAPQEQGLGRELKAVEGMDITIHKTVPTPTKGFQKQRVLKLSGSDHPGILNALCEYFARDGINIDDMTTNTVPAPFSGQPLFQMESVISLPATVTNQKLESEIQKLSDALGVDIWIESYKSAKN